jgi:stage II sporulation protein D
MPANWPLEALKAQAVAARTYAVQRLGSRQARHYDLKPTVEDQVYGGIALEATGSTAAIADTSGQILAYAGKPINAYYCAGAGGFTEGAESVHGFERLSPGHRPGGYPYLQPVPDFDWDSPRWLWHVGFSNEELRRRLTAKGIVVGPIRHVEIVERSYSGRVRWVAIHGELGRHEMTGPELRFASGLASALFSVHGLGNGEFHFVGRGWGHGVGMSQWGARKLAQWGFSYEDILGHYYPGAQLEFAATPRR